MSGWCSNDGLATSHAEAVSEAEPKRSISDSRLRVPQIVHNARWDQQGKTVDMMVQVSGELPQMLTGDYDLYGNVRQHFLQCEATSLYQSYVGCIILAEWPVGFRCLQNTTVSDVSTRSPADLVGATRSMA